MATVGKIVWDASGTKKYELGADHGVLYPQVSGAYPLGVAWNGLTSVTYSPDGAEAQDMWADNIKYGSIRSAETVGGTIECYTYPDEFAACDGSAELAKGVKIGQQSRQPFGFCWRTAQGSDTDNTLDTDASYKLHIVYGATASPSEKQYQTINDSPEAITMSYEFDTIPAPVSGFKPTSYIEIDSKTVDAEKLAALLTVLYGQDAVTGETPKEAVAPRLPLPDEIKTIMAA